MKSLMTLWLLLMVGVALTAAAQQKAPPAAKPGTRIYQTDAYGRVRHDQPSWVVKEDGRIVEVSPYGHEQSHNQQYKVEGDRVYQADFAGRIQYNKPSYSVEKDGRVIQQNPYGHPQYDAPQYVVDGSKVYAADKFGRPKQQAFQVESKAAAQK